MSIPNIWHHRKVADTSAKGCDICFKPSTSVLVTPENRDFFYVCPSHLKDKGFCSPIIDHEAVAAQKKKEAEEAEVEKAKKEYEEKQRKKREKEAEKGKDKKDDPDDGKDSDPKKADKDDEPKPDSKAKSDVEMPPKTEAEPRVFALQRSISIFWSCMPSLMDFVRTFYQQRLDRKRQAEAAKRNRERLSNPNFFPSVPKNLP
ncbi:DUF1742-domain-containing protein [Xylariaceae sp. FL0804]|nr:DUF1742-domain-containing protein [Xylariaceae sp. FL0804]